MPVRLPTMKPDDFLRLALVLYVLGGYIAGYRYARRSLEKAGAKRSNSPMVRAGSWFLLVVMPLSAIAAFYANRHDSFLPLLVGATMNVFWFYAGCLGVLRNESGITLQETEQARGVTAKRLKRVYLGGTILFLACVGFVTAMVLNVATPQTLAMLLVLILIAGFVSIYRGLKAAKR